MSRFQRETGAANPQPFPPSNLPHALFNTFATVQIVFTLLLIFLPQNCSPSRQLVTSKQEWIFVHSLGSGSYGDVNLYKNEVSTSKGVEFSSLSRWQCLFPRLVHFPVTAIPFENNPLLMAKTAALPYCDGCWCH